MRTGTRRHRPPPRALGAVLFLLGLSGCAGPVPAVRAPLDVVVVPGCPSRDDGALSPCQRRRAAWAALLFEQGAAARFIPSGAAVHTPYVEAQALAAAMMALGVPAERIYLDESALHTDENMYYGLDIARRLGLSSLGVASDGSQARGGCSMIRGWGGRCQPLPIDDRRTSARLRAAAAVLSAIRTPRVPPAHWPSVRERERQIAWWNRRPTRPSSALLYLFVLPFTRLFGHSWAPAPPLAPALLHPTPCPRRTI